MTKKKMTTISDIRRNNLLRLYNHYEDEYNQTEIGQKRAYTIRNFCAATGISPAEFSQLKNVKHKPYFNSQYSNKIEESLDLGLGWFDVDRENTELEAIRVDFKLFEKGVLAYADFLESKIIKITDDETRHHLLKNLFVFLYEQPDLSKTEFSPDHFFDFMKQKRR